MSLYDSLLPLIRISGKPVDSRPGAGRIRAPLIALVGGGGKTAALFALGGAASSGGARVLLSTSTRIKDPRIETGRNFDSIVFIPQGAALATPVFEAGVTIVASGSWEGKLLGLDPDVFDSLAECCDILLVEADGSRGLPIKAPAAHEPRIPASADIVLGLVGLDALHNPPTAELVHRSVDFCRIVGCRSDTTLEPAHIARLAASPEGLFKGSPRGAMRVLVLNKLDLYRGDRVGLFRAFAEPPDGVDLVLAGSLQIPSGGGSMDFIALSSRCIPSFAGIMK